MFSVKSALIATYSLNFTLTFWMICGYVTLHMLIIIGLETTFAAIESFLVQMLRICVINKRFGFLQFQIHSFHNELSLMGNCLVREIIEDASSGKSLFGSQRNIRCISCHLNHQFLKPLLA